MIDPVNPNLGLISGCTATDTDSLKHWIRELTDLSPQQIEYLLAQQEQCHWRLRLRNSTGNLSIPSN